MKGGVVTMLFVLRLLLEFGARWTGKVTFTLVPDEETGGQLGTGYLFDSGLIPPVSLGMLMPEPTSGVVWNASRGAISLRVTVRGLPAHVGLQHEGVNAFEQMLLVANALRELKADPKFQRIPVVVLTTSTAEEDIARCYEMGAASYCTKPVSFGDLCELISTMSKYWFEHVRLPPKR